MNIVGYRTENKINGHFYYGVRTLIKPNDPYLGSGKRLKAAVKKYGREAFERIDLVYFKTFKEALEWEKKVITKELILLPECYNLKPGGAGGSLPWTEEKKERVKKEGKYRKTEKTRKKLSISAKKRFSREPGTFLGKEHSEETKKHLSKVRKGRPGNNKGKKLNLSKERLEELKKPKSKEVKHKISRTLCKLSDEQIRFLKEDFIDLYGERSKLAKKWNISLDQIARIIGRKNGKKTY